MLLHILPQVLLGSEPAQLEQYPLRAEVAHCAVYHLHGLVRRYPVQFPQLPLRWKNGHTTTAPNCGLCCRCGKGANDDAVQKAG